MGAVLTSLAVIALITRELVRTGADVGDWDLLFISGCATVLAGLWLARGESGRLADALTRLANRGVLIGPTNRITQEEFDRLLDAVDQRAKQWSRLCGLAVAVLIATSFATVNAMRSGNLPYLDAIGGPLIGALGGLLIGRVLGSMLVYSFVGRWMSAAGLTLKAAPGHVDRAAGLKPLGDFYLYQAFLLAIPATFLLAWSLILLTPKWDDRYSGWRDWYLGFLALAIGLEIAAFVFPLWGVHRTMQEQRREALVEADSLIGPQIASAQQQFERSLNAKTRSDVREQLEQLSESYEAREKMPTWPVDPTVRRRLTLGNLALIIPLVGQIAALAGRR